MALTDTGLSSILVSPAVNASDAPAATTAAPPASSGGTPDITALLSQLFPTAGSANAGQTVGQMPAPAVPPWLWIAGGVVLLTMLIIR